MPLEASRGVAASNYYITIKVLRFGYIMIRIDGYEKDPTGGDWFCYHTSSPFIFPPGFCDRNNIKLKVIFGAFQYWLRNRLTSGAVD